ncbi:Short-chain dehydrogenase/reductase SDR [Nostocoides japonicum T1-X7]|uniref:Short-chain dehydrogenase/reductase SDR n=1 Tax=Nostocoides japonicum T1-X7 TaxID=1194083 RepID=A0A077LZ14_9MICO|nr:SDR family oxidoreductase [Tetrasphaera japonica]CCH79148.1 Short-chain dehydrogenase/reductase SDR [Tetrasphaera japonica T1-X7]
MTNTLDGKVVLITGAGGGIGSATARTVVAQGGHALVHDVSEAGVKALADELGDSATALVADLADMEATQRLWDQAWAVKGWVDVLVNNAGFYPPAPLDATLGDWLAVWDTSLAVHLKGPAVLCRAAVAAYAARPDGGIIINLASRAAFRGEDPDYWHYAAAKAGVVAMTRTIARQNGRQGVTAFAVAPGYVDTNLNEVFRDTVGIQVAADQTGLGEVAQAQDVANIIAFLATGQARHATGTTIDVNGASYVR